LAIAGAANDVGSRTTESPPAVMHGLSFVAETIRGQKISGEAEALKYKSIKNSRKKLCELRPPAGNIKATL